MNKKKNSQKQNTPKQMAAIVGILLLILLYVVTFIMALVDNSTSARWFYICLFATFAIPLLLWIYIWMYGKLTGKTTIADPDIRKTNRAAKTSPGTDSPDPIQLSAMSKEIDSKNDHPKDANAKDDHPLNSRS